MTNETNPPPGEVKLPVSSATDPALNQAAQSLHRSGLPAQASSTIADAADRLERLLYYERVLPNAPGTDAMLMKQSAVLDSLFHTLVCEAITPGQKISCRTLNLALRAQKLCSGTVDAFHRHRKQKDKIL